jgi:hypothetical protein
MSEQSKQPSSQPQPKPDTQSPVSPLVNPQSGLQQGVIPPLPISPFTGEPFDPAWGVPIQKGGDSERTIQQILKHEIERKAIQSDGEAKK